MTHFEKLSFYIGGNLSGKTNRGWGGGGGGEVKFPPFPQFMAKGTLRPKLHPCFYDIFFVDFMDKEPCTKF